MRLVEHRCPNCDFTTRAPFATVSPGDAGIWQCEGCERAYKIHIEFHPIAAKVLQERREKLEDAEAAGLAESFEDEDAEALRAEQTERRLLEIKREMGELRQALQELQEEAEQLERDRDG